MALGYRLKSIQFERKDYDGEVEIKSGWDSFNLLKIEKPPKNGELIYEVNVTNENKGFRLNVVYEFKASPKEDIKNIEIKIKKHVEIDGSSIASIILKYAGIPSVPIFVGGFDSDKSKSANNAKKVTGRKNSLKDTGKC